MAIWKNIGALVGLAGVFCLAGCGGGASSPAPPTVPIATPFPTPLLAQQIRRAEKVGPGFLDYCPTHNGRSPAKYQLDVPGGPVVGGYCATAAVRGHANDTVVFQAYWDGRKAVRHSGLYTLRYSVSRQVTAFSTPQPVLVRQHGPPPP